MMIEVGFVDGNATYKGWLNMDCVEYMYRTKSYTAIGLASGKTTRVYEKPDTIFKMITDYLKGDATPPKETKKKQKADGK